ncbi:hypothetical protein BH24ACT9_BH24ACT9_05170 [soil metagenome]
MAAGGGSSQSRARQSVIDASPALKARERAKHTAYERVLTAGLTARGADDLQARLLARTAVACLDEAIARWFADDDTARPGLEARGRETFTGLARLLRLVGPVRFGDEAIADTFLG